MQWERSVALVTGGAQGIGLGIARALARRGVRLAITDVDGDALASSVRELSDRTEVRGHRLDVRDRDGFAATADRVAEDLGPVDLLFNNAGVMAHAPVSGLDYPLWDLALGVNLGGVVNGVQTFLPRMIERGAGGHIVNTASGAGLVPNRSVAYTTGKFAVVGLSESLRAVAEPLGITVSVVCPGPVATDILRNTRAHNGEDAVDLTDDRRADVEEYLRSGVGIDEAGESVAEGVRRRSTWIHTDASVRDDLRQRADALLASLPS
ncbi:SDR family oxidoreductase [Pseudonocardia sp. ICBG1122]|nr:SDR family oxidoreductase [Pseudonocardia pini]